MLNFENAQNEAIRMKEKIDKMHTENCDNAQEEINRENIKKIEQLNIGPTDKANVMLVSLGLKKSTEIGLYKHHNLKEEVEKVLSDIGLICKSKDATASPKVNSLAVSQNEEILDKLMLAEASQDHEEYGRLMSYPESAIKVFGKEDLLLKEADYPSMKGIIFSFKLSKDNYPKEMELLHEWSEAIKKYAPDTYNELSGENFGASEGFKRYLAGYLEIDVQEFQRIKLERADGLLEHSEYYGDQYKFLKDNRLENVKIAIVPDDLWKKGDQPSESLADDFLILVKESYFKNNDKPDEIAWMLHELAHCKYHYDAILPEKYEEDGQALAFKNIETGIYPNNKIEAYTFTEQFKFLKEKGETREKVVEMLKQYYKDESDFLFFDKLLDEVY